MPGKQKNTDEERLPVRRLNRILTMLLSEMKDLPDEGRDFSIRWNIMHMYSSSQLAKLFALNRGIDPELAGIAAALHDIGLVMTKQHAGHAEAGEKHVHNFLERYNSSVKEALLRVTEEERDEIITAIAQHSQKEVDSHHPFVELLKDVDALDRYLHGVKTEGAHLERCQRGMKELGMEMNKKERRR